MPDTELERLNRLYSVLSRINQCLVRVRSREEFLTEICDVTAGLGGLKVVWIARVDPDTQRVTPVARAGERQGFLDETTIIADDGPLGQGPVGTCVREGRVTLFTDLQHDPRTVAFRAAVAKHGLSSALALPIVLRGKLWGAFAVYDDKRDTFGDNEIGLLMQATNDIAFALEYLDKEVAHQQALVELEASRHRLSLLIEHAPAALAMFDNEMRYLAVSRRWLIDYGLEGVDILGKSHYDIFPEISERWKAVHRRGLAGETVEMHRDRFERLDGTVQWLRWDIRPWRTNVGGVEKVGGIVIFTEDITEFERSEEALRQSESRYRLVSEHGSDVIWLFDLAANRFTYVSPSVERLRGLTVEEVLQQSVQDAVSPQSHAMIAETLPHRLAAFAAGDDSVKIQTHEIDQTRKDGSTVATEVVTTLIADERRRVTHIQGVSRDISMRKHAEEAVREYEARLQAALASMTDAVLISDAEGRFIHFNDAFASFHRIPSKAECPTTLAEYPAFLDVFLPDGTLAPLEKWAAPRALRGEVSTNAEYKLQRKDTGASWFGSYSFAPIRDAQGTIVGSVVVARDITEKKLAEQMLIEHANRLSATLDAAPVPMMLYDAQETIRFVNTTFTRTFGYGPEDVRTLTQWRSLAYTAAEFQSKSKLWRAEFERFAEGRKTFTPVELEVRCRDGSVKTVLASGAMLPHPNEPLYLATIYDITELKRAELARADLESQLQQAQKMESVGRLAGGVAHDFNNMLAAILGHTDFALDMLDSNDPIRAELLEIRRAASRSADLTKQLLAFARKQPVSPVVLDINRTVSGMLKMLERLIGEDIDLEWRPNASLWTVRADPSQLDQILANLCLNARDAISDVGRITIETANRVFDTDYCTTHAGHLVGDYVMLAVSDDGCGMDKQTLAHLFEPFFTTKGVGKGTGLGLATVYGIVKQNSGFINVYSEPGHGTTFRIYLPRCVETSSVMRRPEHDAPTLGSETILVVEDEPTIRELTIRMLEHLGYTVITAASPSMAIEVAGLHANAIHLLVTDVVMPGMNGRDLAAKLIERHPTMKQLYMSGYTANVIAHHGVLDPGVHFIQKPFSRKDLAAAVRAALDQTEPGDGD